MGVWPHGGIRPVHDCSAQLHGKGADRWVTGCGGAQTAGTRRAEGERDGRRGAKNVAAGKAGKMQLRTPTLNGAVNAGQWEPHLHIDGIPITRAKKQLRNRIADWLASHKGYICTVQDMWAGGGGYEARQAGLHRGSVGNRGGGRGTTPGAGPASEVPGAEDAPRQSQGSAQQAPTERDI